MAAGAPDGGRSALLLGATGLVGGHCLDLLLDHTAYGLVRVLSRRPLDRGHPRLEVHLVDFDALDDHAELFAVDDLYCCLGTTIGRAGSEAAFRRVDLDYPVAAGRLAAERGAGQMLVVSAVGADAGSRIFYNRVKGEMEAALARLPFHALWVLRPSLLVGHRDEPRTGERVAEAVMRPLSPLMVGPLRRFRPVLAADVAAAMVRLAVSGGTGRAVESDEITRLATGR